jgi:hypothetical protein
MLNTKDQAKSINFLQPVGGSDGVIQTSFSWLTTIGKWMLIVVEIVVLGAFGYRFVMDGKNNDLTDQINDQVKTLENETWKKSTIKYQNLQSVLGDIEIAKENQELNSKLISEVINGVPLTLDLQNISVNNGKVSLSIKTSDFKALRNYEDTLKSNSLYSDVKVSIKLEGTEYQVGINFAVIKENK